MFQKFNGIGIEAVAACVPDNIITNAHFGEMMSEKELAKFEKTTGIKERRYADEKTTAADLGYIAAKKILEEKNCTSDIEVILFLSQTSDYKIPFTSNILQESRQRQKTPGLFLI